MSSTYIKTLYREFLKEGMKIRTDINNKTYVKYKTGVCSLGVWNGWCPVYEGNPICLYVVEREIK
jgi:hypothetical protein